MSKRRRTPYFNGIRTTPGVAAKNTIKNFWNGVDKSGGPEACWPWTRGTGSVTGYGMITWHGKTIGTHRLAFTLTHGPIPKGFWILHSCDNRPCCNPKHLRIGTNKENVEDRMKRGRQPSMLGEAGPRAKLTEKQVRYIRQNYPNSGILQRELAAMFGVTRSNISAVVRGKSWPHLLPELLGGKRDPKKHKTEKLNIASSSSPVLRDRVKTISAYCLSASASDTFFIFR